jgi:cyclase
MLKPRLIPVLLLKNGILVKSRLFSFHQLTGDPISQVERFTDWKADELIYLDISREGGHGKDETMSLIGSQTSQKDLSLEETQSFVDIIKKVGEKCTIPLTAGGGVKSLSDISVLLKNGADKVSINTKVIEDPEFIKQAAEKFGSQCIVISIDVKRDEKTGELKVYKNFGSEETGLNPVEWSKKVEELGAGEILLNSIDRDGTGKGYDIELIKIVSEAVKIPVIALGGVGKFEDFKDGLSAGASAVAAANIFHFTEQSVINAKKYLKEAGIDVRI